MFILVVKEEIAEEVEIDSLASAPDMNLTSPKQPMINFKTHRTQKTEKTLPDLEIPNRMKATPNSRYRSDDLKLKLKFNSGPSKVQACSSS